MKVIVVGGGGREHALVWKIASSDRVEAVIAAPGSDGIAATPKCRCEAVPAGDIGGQVALARKEKADLVVVGPEAPLVEGLADRLKAEGIPVFGPSRNASRLEGSKVFAKQFMARHRIRTAAFTVHGEIGPALAEVARRRGRCVVKADGLAAGKGVIVCGDQREAAGAVRAVLEERRFGAACDRVIIEDRLEGEEASVLAICDGKTVVPLAAAQDHKAIFEGDRGPNTGGMGAYAPAPVVTDRLLEAITREILVPTVEGMEKDGAPFKGVLYAGVMIVNGEAYVLEYNVRFGDPECQPLMMLMREDLVPLLAEAAAGSLHHREVSWRPGSSLCVVLASRGYPGSYEKGKPISGLESAASNPNVAVFHAGTRREGGRFLTDGGRVLGVTAWGADLAEAAREAYAAANRIHFDGMQMRRDIGYRAL